METAHLRAEIHEYVDQADDRFLNLVYGMIKADNTSYELSEHEIKVIEERLYEYNKNPSRGRNWNIVKDELSGKK